jgi:hypothetical protein
MIEQQNDYKKIIVYVLTQFDRDYIIKDGVLHAKPDRLQYFYDPEPSFREPIITFINEDIGLYNWAIKFRPFTEDVYEAYIYCPTKDDFHKISSIIRERLSNKKIRLFERVGTIEDYLAETP